ncbi:MAG: DUF2399 domain-containing protein [Firmicutes bacterium]|nr:DUF2399 domain-containing protein [Bacillota bacterium]
MELSAIQEKVLHLLLDRCERRKDYGSKLKSPRRVLLPVNRINFPDYFHVSDSSFRFTFNRELEALERCGWVELDWVRFDRGQTLQRIALVEPFPEIYSALGRPPRKQLYREAAEYLAGFAKGAPERLAGLCRVLGERLAALEPLPPPLKAEQLDLFRELLQGLQALFEERESDIARRVLSVRLYGDSKRWERLERGLLQLARECCLPPEEAALDDTALLAEYGIIDHPSHILLSGPLSFGTARGVIELASFYPDLGLPAEMVRDLEIIDCRAAAVITIENKTSFYQYLREGEPEHLAIYLGGYHNRGRRLLLEKLYRYFQKVGRAVPFYHWGDLDLGGFQIWHHLKTRTGIPFKPFLMDLPTYRHCCHLGRPFAGTYRDRLAALLEDPAYAVFHPLIELMLEKGVRVEQEAVPLG